MRKLEIKEVQDELLVLMNSVHEFLGKNGINYYLIAGSALGSVRHNGFIPWDDDIDIGLFRKDYEKFIELSKAFNPEYEVVNFNNANNVDFFLTRIYINDTLIDNRYIRTTKLDKRLYFDIFPIDNVPEDEEERTKYEKKINRYKKIIALCDVRDYSGNLAKLLIKRVIARVLSPFRQTILKNGDKLMKKYMNCETNLVCSLCSLYSFSNEVMLKSIYGNPTLHKFANAEYYIPEQSDPYLITLYGVDYMQIPPENKRRKGHDIYRTDED